MNHEQFEQIKSELIGALAASMSAVLQSLGERARDVDLVSMKHAVESYVLSQHSQAA